MAVIPAAGTIPWRVVDDVLQVALVHRPRYDDWSWPKGKLDPGEEWSVAAVRETAEETGLDARLGRPAPESRYTVLDKDGTPDDKVVRYWSARVVGGHGRLDNEIDELAWLDVQSAWDRLDYSRDRDQLLALVRDHQNDTLDTWPLLVVRHSRAVARGAWKGGDDRERPLDARGTERSAALVPILAAYGVTRLVTSPSLRCVDTIAPYAARARLTLRLRSGLSEEGHEERPDKAAKQVARLLEIGEPAALCSHGPVLPAILGALSRHLHTTTRGAVDMIETLAEATDERLVKGEALVCHVTGAGPGARIVAVERHLP